MRHAVLIPLLFLSLTYTSYAQMEKGFWLISGQMNVSFNANTNDFQTQSGFTFEGLGISRSIDFSPRIGYMLSDTWLLGADTNFGRFKSNQNQANSGSISSGSEEWINSWGIGVFSRKFFDFDENLQFFVEGRVGRSWWTQEYLLPLSTRQTNQTELNYGGRLSIGLHYWMLPNLSLEINVPFFTATYQEIRIPETFETATPSKTINQGIRFAFGQSLGIGFNFLF